MNSSFYNGISGVKSGQFGIDVQANNIANISTIGYKNKTAEFSDYFSTALTDSYFDSTSNDSGLGSKAQTASTNMTQGILQGTDNVFDLAINGEGWFGVQGANGETFYTRAGAFSIDSQGNMVDPSGNYLLATSGENITETTLSDDVLEDFGTYYRTDVNELGQAYSISSLSDVQLGTVETQSIVNLPDILYFPPEATTYVNYQANLNPQVTTDNTTIGIDSNDIGTPTFDETNNTISIAGTISNTQEAQNPEATDTVIVTISDINGDEITFNTVLNSDLTWNISNADISSLDTSNKLTTSAFLQTTQEIPNVEYFTTDIISPDGKKNIVDMVFTKQVPQDTTQTTWNADIEILSYFEEYVIEQYDATKTYDDTIYNVDTTSKQVTKIYDPTLYKVDTGTNKVYKIVDSQTGSATFAGNGELINSDIPTLSNGDTPLNISIGTQYEEEILSSSYTVNDGNIITFSGTSTDIDEGKTVYIDIADESGNTVTTTATIQSDGSWTTSYENNLLVETDTLTTNAYSIINNGFDGMTSSTNLDKARRSDKDGYVEGLLTNYGMDGSGNIVAEFDNGRSATVAKVAVYHFQNDQGLENVSTTLFKKSANSGDAIFYTDENGNNILGSSILANKLESSNVSLATALTELIVLQKSFDSSAKCITTSDEMIQNAINMKS